MSAQYNLPMHMGTQNGDDYVIDESYPHDVTPPGMGWDGQSDGGGKFRLKRRRRCGQCGPCQVKENCNKCQYCMRKDVLKQACVYRKCVYLRKPVPRFRQEPTNAGGATQKSAPVPPTKPTSTPVPPPATVGDTSSANNSGGSVITNGTTSSNSNNSSSSSGTVPVAANPHMSSPSSMSATTAHSTELSSCRLNQSQFVALSAVQGMNNGVLDPLRHRIMDQPHRSLFDPMNHHSSLDPSRSALDSSKSAAAAADVSRFSNGSIAQGLNSHCKLDKPVAVQANDVNPSIAASLNSMNSALSSHHSQPSKCPSLAPRDPYFPSMETWSSMPYALPHTPAWPTAALPNHHAAAAAAYGFQQHTATFPSSFSPSSCRLGMPDPAATRYVPPHGPQHSFHHSMTMAGFPQDFAHAAPNHPSHANMRAPMNPTFYTPSPHITSSSIHGFSGLGQFPAGQASFAPAAYSMHPHAHMYPSSFYSFRTATEPQIYHVQVYPNHNPFKNSLQQLSVSFWKEKGIKNVSKNLECGLLGKSLEFGLFEEINLGFKYSEKQYLEMSSNISQNFEEDSVSSFSSKLMKRLKAKCDASGRSFMYTSQDTCNVNIMKSMTGPLNNSEGKDRKPCIKNKKKGVLTESTFDQKFLHCGDKDSSSCDTGHANDSSEKESFPLLEDSDQDLRDYHTWTMHDFKCESDDEFSLAMCGRAGELGSDINSDDDDDDEFLSPKTDEKLPESSDLCSYSLSFPSISSSSSSVTTRSRSVLLPAMLPSSSPHLSESEAADVSSEASSSECEPSTRSENCCTSHESLCLNEREQEQELPCSDLIVKISHNS